MKPSPDATEYPTPAAGEDGAETASFASEPKDDKDDQDPFMEP